VVDVVKKLFGAVKAGVGKVTEWWKQKKPFKTESGASHEIYFTGDEKKSGADGRQQGSQAHCAKAGGIHRPGEGKKRLGEEKGAVDRIKAIQAALKKDPNADILGEMKIVFDIFEPQKTAKKFDVNTYQGASAAFRMWLGWAWSSTGWMEITSGEELGPAAARCPP